MRQPLRVNRSRRTVSRVVTVPPPIRGWNARDALPMMKPDDAIELVNIIPGTNHARLRRGYEIFATGMTDPVESLMEYSPQDGDDELFAAADDTIYDVTSGTPSADVTSLGNARWQHVNFSTAGGHFLVACNGEDAVRNYDGSSWTSPTINNVTSSTLINVSIHAERLFFVEEDSLSAWYLAARAISGDAAELPIGSFCRLGGYLVATGSWTRDGGSGPDDLFVMVTSKGEVLIYSGIDPSAAETWQLVGVFRIAEPIGRRCLVKAGSELGILTVIGVVPMSQVLSQAESAQSSYAITDKISNAFGTAADSYRANFGWSVTEYPREKLLIVNVPKQVNTLQEQYVMNTDSGAWCTFTGLNVNCWSLFGDDLYGGTNDGKVIKYGPDFIDDTETIPATIRQAFNDFGSPNWKRFVMARPRILGASGYRPGLEIKKDFDVSPITAPSTNAADSGAEWDLAEWDVSDWPDSSKVSNRWQSISVEGYVGAPAFSISTGIEFTLFGTDVMYEEGGAI